MIDERMTPCGCCGVGVVEHHVYLDDGWMRLCAVCAGSLAPTGADEATCAPSAVPVELEVEPRNVVTFPGGQRSE